MAPQGRTDRAPTPAPALRAGAPSTAPLPPLLWPRPYTRPFRLGAAVTQVSDGQDGLGRFSDPFFLMIRSQKEMHVRGQVRVHRSRVPAPGTEARPPSERGLPTRVLALSRKRTERDAADQLLTANPGGQRAATGDASRRQPPLLQPHEATKRSEHHSAYAALEFFFSLYLRFFLQ